MLRIRHSTCSFRTSQKLDDVFIPHNVANSTGLSTAVVCNFMDMGIFKTAANFLWPFRASLQITFPRFICGISFTSKRSSHSRYTWHEFGKLGLATFGLLARSFSVIECSTSINTTCSISCSAFRSIRTTFSLLHPALRNDRSTVFDVQQTG